MSRSRFTTTTQRLFACLGSTTARAHHVWIDRHSYTIQADPTFKRQPTLYMNPPPNVLPGMDGYFRTRKLDARKHGIVDAVLAHAKRAGPIEAAIAKVKARERE
jgi:hypothetical protein